MSEGTFSDIATCWTLTTQRCDLTYADRIYIYNKRKHAYSHIFKISPPKPKSSHIKNSDIFNISAQNIDCGYSLEPPRRGGSNEYPQSMFLSRNKKK